MTNSNTLAALANEPDLRYLAQALPDWQPPAVGYGGITAVYISLYEHLTSTQWPALLGHTADAGVLAAIRQHLAQRGTTV